LQSFYPVKQKDIVGLIREVFLQALLKGAVITPGNVFDAVFMAEPGNQREKVYTEYQVISILLQISGKPFTEKIIMEFVRKMIINGFATVACLFQIVQNVIAGITSHIIKKYLHLCILLCELLLSPVEKDVMPGLTSIISILKKFYNYFFV